MSTISTYLDKDYKKDIAYTLLFGLISNLVGLLRITAPDLELTSIDLREIPLLISLIFIKNPLYTLGMSVLSLIDISDNQTFAPLIITHFVALSVVWYPARYISKSEFAGILKGGLSVVLVIIYYYFLIIPLFVITYHFVEVNNDMSFSAFYLEVFQSINYEVAATTFSFAVFILQHDFRIKLRKQNQELEKTVEDRTHHLQETIKELKITQHQLVQSEKMASLGTLTSGVAHEINNPLNYVNGGIHIISDLVEQYSGQLPPDFIEKYEEASSISLEGSSRITNIVQTLMTFYKAGESKKEPYDLHKVIDDTLMFLRAGTPDNIEITKDYKFKGNVPLFVEKSHQLILNIVKNAISALQKPEIDTKLISISTHQENDHAIIEIINSGHPIPDAQLKQIFDPFYTTRDPDKGKGLGLAICYAIVQEHGGEITAKNIDSGVSFRIELPLA